MSGSDLLVEMRDEAAEAYDRTESVLLWPDAKTEDENADLMIKQVWATFEVTMSAARIATQRNGSTRVARVAW